MTYNVAKDAVDWLIKNKRWKNEHGFPNEKVEIIYFGGEPTLLWDEIIMPLTQYAFDTYPNEIHFNITTNGTLLNEERIRFMAKYDIYPLLSIDGAPETQNYNRPCHNSNQLSFDLVKDNIPILLKYFPNTTFRSTINERTVAHTFENYIFAQYMGFKNIYMMPNGRAHWSEENLTTLKEEFKRIYMYIITCFEEGHYPPIAFSPINDSFRRIKEYNMEILYPKQHENNVKRCGLGTVMGSIGYNGNIYGCQEQDSKEKESKFYLGNIYQGGIDKNKHEKFFRDFYDSNYSCEIKEYCDTCPLALLCHGLNCPSTSYDLFQDFGMNNYVNCYWLRLMYEQAIITLKYLDQNPVFRQYLINYCSYDFLREEEK